MRRTATICILISLIAVITIPWMTARATQQGVPGFAEITDPAPDQPIAGLITIQGTAFHPDFESYELFFSYDPNPTDTWFPLTEKIETPVQEDGLALWDTSTITPGRYQLRLQVHSNQGQMIEAIVSDLRLGQESLTTQDDLQEARPAADPDAEEQPAAPSDSQPSQPVQEVSAPATPEQTLWRLLLTGAFAAAIVIIGYGGYSLLRPRVRQYLGLLRMRQMPRNQRRRDRERPSN